MKCKNISPLLFLILSCLFFPRLNVFSKPRLLLYHLHAPCSMRDTVPRTDSIDSDNTEGKVGVEAFYPAGEKAWINFLGQNINTNIATQRKAPAGHYTVIVQFVVNTDGKIIDIKPLTQQGFGMEQEVMRVLRNAPHWNPASLDGRPVKVYRKQPVTFVVEEEKRKQRG